MQGRRGVTARLISDENMHKVRKEIDATKRSQSEFWDVSRRKENTYLTRFSDAMTEVDTAFPRACNSMVSWVSRYFLPRNT